MENLTLQQLINQTREALIDAGASNYYQNVFKTLTKQLLLYAKEHNTESFSMDFGLRFLEDHYSMSSKIEQKKWCATYCAVSLIFNITTASYSDAVVNVGYKEFNLILAAYCEAKRPDLRSKTVAFRF